MERNKMLLIDPEKLPVDIDLVTPFVLRKITHAFHDIDGTHSLIRDWVPVMTLVTGFVAENGLPEADDPADMAKIMSRYDPAEFPEGHRFAIESAGLSALTQMEWALRRAAQNHRFALPGEKPEVNDAIVARIWQGEEEFPEFAEPERLRAMLEAAATRLFRAYEILLLEMGRDRNLAAANCNPSAWRVPGSLEFLQYLRSCGVCNYFVTGAVIEYAADGTVRGTMAEEIEALGLGAHPGGIIEKLVGSAWNEKLPKDKIMQKICRDGRIDPANVLVIGDGRSEIAAAVGMKALAMSRLGADAERAREIHRALHTNLIVEHYELAKLKRFMLPC